MVAVARFSAPTMPANGAESGDLEDRKGASCRGDADAAALHCVAEAPGPTPHPGRDRAHTRAAGAASKPSPATL